MHVGGVREARNNNKGLSLGMVGVFVKPDTATKDSHKAWWGCS